MAESPKIPILEFEEVDFEIEREVWNIYELGDRSRIKMRTVLVKLLRSRARRAEKPTLGALELPEFQGKFQNIITVVSSVSTSLGPPSPPIPPQELASLPKDEVACTPYQEDWNIYRLPDGSKLKVKVVVSAVYRVKNKYDELGYPIYWVNSTNAVAPVPKPE